MIEDVYCEISMSGSAVHKLGTLTIHDYRNKRQSLSHYSARDVQGTTSERWYSRVFLPLLWNLGAPVFWMLQSFVLQQDLTGPQCNPMPSDFIRFAVFRPESRCIAWHCQFRTETTLPDIKLLLRCHLIPRPFSRAEPLAGWAHRILAPGSILGHCLELFRVSSTSRETWAIDWSGI